MKLLATSTVRTASPAERRGDLYLIDLDDQSVQQCVPGKAGRALRGIAFDTDTVYLADGEELLAYGPDFRLIASWRNPYLRDCRDITVYERTLYLVSSSCDSILGFNLDTRKFEWAMQVAMQEYQFAGRRFDPGGEDGPLHVSKLELDSIHCDSHGMYLGGQRSGGMLHFNGQSICMAAELPAGSLNARPFRDGVLFNDTKAGALRYTGRGEGEEDRAMPVPACDPEASVHGPEAGATTTERGFARGLCVISEWVVAGGSSPATITLYDLARNRELLSVQLSRDAAHTIHSIAIWPFD